MNPLLTFTAGILAGVAVVRYLKDEKTRDSLSAAETRAREAASHGGDVVRSRFDQVQDSLRGAAVSSLTAVEQSSARLRAKLTPAPAEPAEPPAAPKATRGRKAAAPKEKAAKAGTRSPRKKATATTPGGEQS